MKPTQVEGGGKTRAASLVRSLPTDRVINNAAPPLRSYRNLMSFNEKVVSRHHKVRNNSSKTNKSPNWMTGIPASYPIQCIRAAM